MFTVTFRLIDLFHCVVLHKLGGLLISSVSTLLPRPWRDSRAGKEKGGKAEAGKEEAARSGAASGVAGPAVSACKAAAVAPLRFLPELEELRAAVHVAEGPARAPSRAPCFSRIPSERRFPARAPTTSAREAGTSNKGTRAL